MRSILVAMDQFPAAETTVSVAAGLASVLETPLCILHVRPAAAAPVAPTAAPRPPDPDRIWAAVTALLAGEPVVLNESMLRFG